MSYSDNSMQNRKGSNQIKKTAESYLFYMQHSDSIVVLWSAFSSVTENIEQFMCLVDGTNWKDYFVLGLPFKVKSLYCSGALKHYCLLFQF